MTSAASHNSQTAVCGESRGTVPNRAVLILLAGMAAAWFAAGSTGLFSHSLRHALSWIALGTAVVAAWPEEKRNYRAWALLALGAIIGILFTATSQTAVNVLAVAVVMAAISRVCSGHAARLALIGAMAATVLGCFRFACDSIPIVWHAADRIGWAMGKAGRSDLGQTARHRRDFRRTRFSRAYDGRLRRLVVLHAAAAPTSGDLRRGRDRRRTNHLSNRVGQIRTIARSLTGNGRSVR